MARHLGAALQWVRAAIPVRPAACATVTQCPTARRPRRAAVPASRSGKLIQAGVVAVSLMGGFGHAADHCSRDWACIEVQESEQGVALFARNMKPYPIAMTVAVSASNMVGGSREPITLELIRSVILYFENLSPAALKRLKAMLQEPTLQYLARKCNKRQEYEQLVFSAW